MSQDRPYLKIDWASRSAVPQDRLGLKIGRTSRSTLSDDRLGTKTSNASCVQEVGGCESHLLVDAGSSTAQPFDVR